MKKSIITTATAVLASLALAGCSAGNQSADPAPRVTATSSAPKATPTPNASSSTSASPSKSPVAYPTDSDGVQVLPPEIRAQNGYLDNNGANSFEGWAKGTPQRATITWESDGTNRIRISVADGDWSKTELPSYADSVMSAYGCKEGIDRVTVQTEDSSLSASSSAC